MGMLSDGRDSPRPDGILKITGAAQYTADHELDGLVHGVVVTSAVAKGLVVSIDVAAALAMPGVLGVVTHKNVAAIRGTPPPLWPEQPEELLRRPDHGASLTLADNVVRYTGQPVALVIADTFANATDAASRLRVDYAVDDARLDMAGWIEAATEPSTGEIPGGDSARSTRGDATVALADAAVVVRQTYTSATAHQNPIEPAATIAHWTEEAVLVYDSNQGPNVVAEAVSAALGLEPGRVRVISRYVGGGFGCKLQLWPHGYLAVLGSKLIGRPVKVVLTRPQMFTGTGHRPEVIQEIALGAD